MKKKYTIYELLFLAIAFAVPSSLIGQEVIQEDCSIDLTTSAATAIVTQGLATGTFDETGTEYTLTGNGWNAFNIPQEINLSLIHI